MIYDKFQVEATCNFLNVQIPTNSEWNYTNAATTDSNTPQGPQLKVSCTKNQNGVVVNLKNLGEGLYQLRAENGCKL